MNSINFFKELKWKLIENKIKRIKLVVLDVDGVMTDGCLFYDSKGNQIKKFAVQDGLGIRLLQEIGIKIGIISGGKANVIEKRASDLNIENIYTNIKNKKECMKHLQAKLNVSIEETIYLGDDINDLVVRESVGLLICTNDGSRFLKKKSNAVLIANGGENAVRELTERILWNNVKFKEFRSIGFIERN